MSLVTANGVGVLSGHISRSLVGVWIADLVVDQSDASSFVGGTKVTIASQNGYQLSGTVDPNRNGAFIDDVHVRIIGGGAGMNKLATPKGYVQPHAFVRDVVGDLLTGAGETLSDTTDATFLGTNVAAWSVMGTKKVNWNLRALLNIIAPSMNWRVLADGTVWIGNESWPSASGTFDSIEYDPKEGSYLLGVESPFVAPGTNLDGVGNVNLCVDVIESGKLRTHVYVDMPSEGDRDIASEVGRIVSQKTAGIDYFARYDCQVVTQSADLTTVDVQPLGARNQSLLGGLQRVPVRCGTGIKIKFPVGAKVLLGWDGGDPAGPYVTDGRSDETPLAIQLAGDEHPLPLWDKFQDAINALIGVIAVIIGSSSPSGPLAGLAAAYAGPPHVPPFATNADALAGWAADLAIVANYQSQIVSNG